MRRLSLQKRDARQRDQEAWQAAQYIALALLSPGSYPAFPLFTPEESPCMAEDQIREKLEMLKGVL